MIASLRGFLMSKSPTEVIVDVHGVGYMLSIPLSTFEKLGELRSEVFLHTHLIVREDAQQLYGFFTEEERSAFRLLLSVTGIGPKMAQGILSGIPVNDLKSHLASGNLGALTAIPGIGRKLAERLVVELREKTTKSELPPSFPVGGSDDQARSRTEALLALTSLGYPRPVAEKALRGALQDPAGKTASLEQLIKLALRYTGK
jgi:Holliday junction DNA helicase RuvA